MELTVVQSSDAYTHLALAGRLDVAGEQAVGTEFAAYAGAGKSLIVDLSQVSFLASLGIRMLFQGAKTLFAGGVKMVLLNPQPLVEEILQTAGLTELMPITHDEGEAQTIAKG
ncbi:STAS domain-containing protein [Desulfatibacillum aliphaticivorans]|uniref:Anti-sigma factor antagonist n=1 Tax=Desulfatibacillum aliphaticivorans TaxID=218208 RepID=B8FBY2_DESAL|nr:STAS domain-containing protein [Desulfatibacillum aliphaticivorans]ACL05187.1 anti-sigma-factor antagonist [Desulfatibacillum aliphaticivorans]